MRKSKQTQRQLRQGINRFPWASNRNKTTSQIGVYYSQWSFTQQIDRTSLQFAIQQSLGKAKKRANCFPTSGSLNHAKILTVCKAPVARYSIVVFNAIKLHLSEYWAGFVLQYGGPAHASSVLSPNSLNSNQYQPSHYDLRTMSSFCKLTHVQLKNNA